MNNKNDDMNSYIKTFSGIGMADTAIVGGKNSSLGEMFNRLSAKGVAVPDGFATTAFAAIGKTDAFAGPFRFF
jgi:phosphoenolpyruvate synthase/pyruvate phosphate dikinase